MITLREYKPIDNELIYHYCDGNAFISICTNKKLWFNDIFSMNDYMEMHWGYSIWEKAAGLRIEKYGKKFLDEIDEIIHFSGLQGLLLAVCFSREKDLLSQWRSYANNGEGYVIGFNAKELLGLPIRALNILYKEEEQIKESIATIDWLHEIKQTDNAEFKILCGVFAYDISAFKNPSFEEEKEVRLIHLLNLIKSNNFLKLKDEGGVYFGEERIGEKVKFRIIKEIPSPYIELDFSNNGIINPIKEIVIGPRNNVLPTAISIFLETIGLGKVKIIKSKASYR